MEDLTMHVATIKGATHNPGAPAGWTEANGSSGALPIIFRKDKPAAAAHDRRHDDAQVSAKDPT
jgi:hypothetical protein